LNRAKASR